MRDLTYKQNKIRLFNGGCTNTSVNVMIAIKNIKLFWENLHKNKINYI